MLDNLSNIYCPWEPLENLSNIEPCLDRNIYRDPAKESIQSPVLRLHLSPTNNIIMYVT